jgi:hypothetical protein
VLLLLLLLLASLLLLLLASLLLLVLLLLASLPEEMKCAPASQSSFRVSPPLLPAHPPPHRAVHLQVLTAWVLTATYTSLVLFSPP